jgi:hypothetical protein
MTKINNLSKEIWKFLENKQIQATLAALVATTSTYKAFMNIDKPEYLLSYGAIAMIWGSCSYLLYKEKI